MVVPSFVAPRAAAPRRPHLPRLLLAIAILVLGLLVLFAVTLPRPAAWLAALVEPQHYDWGVLLGLWLAAQGTMWLSPQPKAWSRPLIVALLLGLALRYFLWRGLTTLNLADPANAIFSITLLVLEGTVAFNLLVQLLLVLNERDRSAEADYWEQAVLAGDYQPSVDILIPTYSEPVWVLKRTIVGCQAIDYSDKQVYLLDDGRRPEVAELAAQLGCHYIARPDNRHAKAGNLNYAIARTHGELIACFDADFVPTRNFLQRTVGFFQDPNLGLVQTNQGCYNLDLIATNLGIEADTPPETEVFSRYYQRLRDGADSVICYGSSFVVRRSALAAVGNFVTGTVGEDYLTSICLSARGYELVYLDEKLSAGLAAENLTGHVIQRQRWAKGTFQGLFVPANPFLIPGLNLRQRLTHFDQIIQWAVNFCRLGFLLVPLGYAVFGLSPIQATTQESLYFLAPFYLLQLTAFAWLNRRSRSVLMSDLYLIVECVPIAISIIDTLLRPFASGFKVTPKGVTSKRFTPHIGLALPLAIALLISLGSCLVLGAQLVQFAADPASPFSAAEQLQRLQLGFFWGLYGAFFLTLAIFATIDVPKSDRAIWFSWRQPITLLLGDNPSGTLCERTYSGTTRLLSEAGALLDWPADAPALPPGTLGQCYFPAADLRLPMEVLPLERGKKGKRYLRLAFPALNLEQERRLIELLFCRPGQWPFSTTPSEGRVLWLLLRSLVRPRWLTGHRAIAPTAVQASPFLPSQIIKPRRETWVSPQT